MAVQEDFGGGDPTSEITIRRWTSWPRPISCRAKRSSSAAWRWCGEILKQYDKRLKLKVLIDDGERASVADRLGVIEGPLRPMLSAERVVLNFLQRLCGISTMTWKFVSAVRGTRGQDL